MKELVEKIIEYTKTWSITETEWYWNNKLSNEVKKEIDTIYKQLDTFKINNVDYLDNIKELEKLYNKYKKALETEENCKPFEYEKMSLASGTTEEENKIMIRNNLKDRFKSIKE